MHVVKLITALQTRDLSQLSSSLTEKLEGFVQECLPPEMAKLLGSTLPRRLLRLVELLNSGLHQPSLLLPRLSCSRARAQHHASQSQSYSAGGSAPGADGDDDDYDEVKIGEMPQDVDISALGTSCLGGSSRSRAWHALVSSLKSIVDPLGNILPQLLIVGPLFENTRGCLAEAKDAIRDISQVVEACAGGKNVVLEFLQSLSSEIGGDRGQPSGNVMDKLSRAVDLAKSMNSQREAIGGRFTVGFIIALITHVGVVRCCIYV